MRRCAEEEEGLGEKVRVKGNMGGRGVKMGEGGGKAEREDLRGG